MNPTTDARLDDNAELIVPHRPSAAWLAEARMAIASFESLHPDITRWGFRVDGDLLGIELPSVECVATCLAFIAAGPVRKTRSAKDGQNSYALKHDAERWGRWLGFAPYVANGDMICAALHYDLMVRHITGTPNAMIGLRVIDATCTQHGRVITP